MNERRRLWHGIRAALVAIGRMQIAVLFWVVYVVLWMPVGLLLQIRADWLNRRAPSTSNWWARPARINDPSHTSQQF